MICAERRFRPERVEVFPGGSCDIYHHPIQHGVFAIIIIDLIDAVLDDFFDAGAGIFNVGVAANLCRIGLGVLRGIPVGLCAGIDFCAGWNIAPLAPGVGFRIGFNRDAAFPGHPRDRRGDRIGLSEQGRGCHQAGNEH